MTTYLGIDIESYSSVALTKSGVYVYTEAEDFEILLFGYAFDDGPVNVVDLTNSELPYDALDALQDPAVIKTAFNANFERTCIARHFSLLMPPEQWQCTQAHALTLGMPINLTGVARCLNIAEQKMDEGKALIRFFCSPCTPANNQLSLIDKTRNLPADHPVKWQQFKLYCNQDVLVKREIRNKLSKYPMVKNEQKLWQLDQKINDYGVKVDKTLVRNAITCADIYNGELAHEAQQLTGLENPNSAEQLKSWLKTKHGISISSLSKEKVEELIKTSGNRSVLKRVLELRQEMSKTSVKKYEAADRTMCRDERIRGMLQYYGANRGGRWTGRHVQVHNLPRNYLRDLDLARGLLRNGEYENLEMLFGGVPDTLSQLIRTAFIPSDGCRFIVCDFSAIEARVISWLAGEQWRIDVFNGDGKIYEAAAAQMFRVPVESIDKGSELRQKGKIAELSGGYGGGVNALIAMGALKMGLKEEELDGIVKAWRKANPNIVKLWRDLEAAALKAVKGKTTVDLQHGVQLVCENGMLFIKLPSGRSLAYVRPKIDIDKRFGRDQITYEGYEAGQWKRISTFGGKIAENVVQAIARDCLADSMLRLASAGYGIAFHVHDEVVLDMPHGQGALAEVEELMGQPISWAPGLPMTAAGFECDYYKKD